MSLKQPPIMLERTPNSPRFNWRTFVPSDSRTFVDLFSVDVAGLYVGTPGNVAIVDASGHADVIVNASGVIPGWFRQVKSSGTTASNIMAIW